MANFVSRNQIKSNLIRNGENRTNHPPLQCSNIGDGEEHNHVEHFCVECEERLCKLCSDAHKRNRATKGHTLKITTETADRSSNLLNPCQDHKGHEIKAFCRECKQPCCLLCQKTNHIGHDVDRLSQVDEESVAELQETLNAMKIRSKECATQLEQVISKITQLDNQYSKVVFETDTCLNKAKNEMQAAFDRVMAKFDESRTNVLETTKKNIFSERNWLENKKKETELTASQLKQYIKLHEQLLASDVSSVERAIYVKVHKPASETNKLLVAHKGDGMSAEREKNERWRVPFDEWKDRTEQLVTQTTSLWQANSRAEYTGSAITVSQLVDNKFGIGIVSLWKSKLLLGCAQTTTLYIYDSSGSCLDTIENMGSGIADALWTQNGDIICATAIDKERKVLFLICGKTKAIKLQLPFAYPNSLSLFSENLYLSDWKRGVFVSPDGGKIWHSLFEISDGFKCTHMIKVATPKDNSAFWTIERKDKILRLRRYLPKRNGYELDWKEMDAQTIELPKPFGKNIELEHSKLLFDGDSRILLNDFHNSAIHVFLTNGVYECQLLGFKNGLKKPLRLALDKSLNLLYVGMQKGEVKVYEMSRQNDNESDRL